MNVFAKRVLQLVRSEDGATTVEYAVMLALILLAAIVGIETFGQATNACFEYSRDEMNKVMP